MISSTQQLYIKGTGVQITNVSRETLQKISMTAIQSSCSDDNCLIDILNDITNNFITVPLADAITTGIKSTFSSAIKSNMSLIIISGSFVVITIIAYVFLLFKKAASSPK